MKLFTQKKSDDYIVIIGCGRLGASLANTLSEQDGNVLVIDNDKDSFRKLSPSFGGLTLTGDATDADVLQEAQIEKATVVISVTNNDNTNIMIAQMAKELFKKERVIARLYDPELECVCQEFGIDTICPAVLSIKRISNLLDSAGREENI
ncbi:MAG: TrkA-N domain protein [Clostridia bacterium]|nr:TrkA-N domain protein [Clostridia bacterium]